MLQAIETSYKGYRFRSRLEARWAVFFDALGIRWEYEKQGYNLGAAGLYLPDFWLPDVYLETRTPRRRGVWIEIKDESMASVPSSRAKAHALGAQDQDIVVFYGLPNPLDLGDVCCGDTEHVVSFALDGRAWFLESPGGDARGYSLCEAAANRARSARFEHGERPR